MEQQDDAGSEDPFEMSGLLHIIRSLRVRLYGVLLPELREVFSLSTQAQCLDRALAENEWRLVWARVKVGILLLPSYIAFLFLFKHHSWSDSIWIAIGVIGIVDLCGRVLARKAIARSLRRAICEHGIALCLECGYNLRGNVSGLCPECGKPVVGMSKRGDVETGTDVKTGT